MAIDVESLQRSGHGFAICATSADASGCEVLFAAPGTGKAIVLEGLLLNSAAALTITVGAGKTDTAVTSAILGPIALAANSTVVHRFVEPVRLSANTALTVDASGAGVICVLAEGFVADG